MTASADHDPEVVLDEVVTEYLRAVESGRPIDLAPWLIRHPDRAAELAAFLADHAAVERWTVPLRQPTQRGEQDAIDHLGDYELLQELGRGGMGVVHRARQRAANRVVALKMILAGGRATPREILRFRFEAETAANLDHPNILPIYDVGEHEGRPYFSMKLVEGGSLADHCHRLAEQPREAARLVGLVARAVHFAHQRGVLHRDLKPANILLDDQGQPYVADFGLARRVEEAAAATATGAIIGTAAYMAPEQARAERALTTAVDVYGVGAILYQLLTGRPPFRAETPVVTLLQVLEQPVVEPRSLRPSIDADLQAICLRCLEKNPGDRYPSAAEVADDLQHFLNGEPIAARSTGFWQKLARAVSSRVATSTLGSSWPSLVWLGVLFLVTHTVVFALVVGDQPVPWLWGVLILSTVWRVYMLWRYLISHARTLTGVERHSLAINVGSVVGEFAFFLLYGPLSPTAPIRTVLNWYPARAVLSGFSTFVHGTTHWGLFYLIGLFTMALALPISLFPEAGPLIFGVSVGVWMIWAGLLFRSEVREN